VVNLNARSVVAASPERAGPEDAAILDRTLRRMVQEESWQACRSCDLAATCYAHHNASTFAHPTAGLRIAGRLRTLYELVALMRPAAHHGTGPAVRAGIHAHLGPGLRRDPRAVPAG
jgi:hypothetical protein